mgnify:CR=1 FL=1
MCQPSPPAAPDPRAVAGAQSEFNERAARTTAALNRYDTKTPYGSQTWKNVGGTTPDYDAFNQALTAYNAQPAAGGGGSYQYNPDVGAEQWMPQQNMNRGAAPTLDQFQKPGDQWETSINLSPEGQQLFDSQNRIATNLMRTAGDQLGRVERTINEPMNLYGLPDRVSGVSPSTGYAGGIADAGTITRGYDPVQFGSSFGDAGQISRSYDPVQFQSGFADVGGAQRSVGANDFSADRQRVEDAILSRLNPMIDRDREAQRANLILRGHNPSTEAFGREADQFNRQANDARMQAVLAGGQEQSRLFGLDLAKGQFANQAQAQDYGQALGRGAFGQDAASRELAQRQNRMLMENQAQAQAYGQELGRGTFANDAASRELAQRAGRASFANQAQGQQFGQNERSAQFQNAERQQQLQEQLANANLSNSQRQAALQELLALRLNPLNELNALRTGNQVQMPQFTPGPSVGVQPADYTGAARMQQQGQQAQYQADVGSANNMQTGLFGIGAATAPWWMPLIAASDRRLKSNIVRIGTHQLGIGIYEYNIFDRRERGVMADEVLTVRPQAVLTHQSGYLMVDYGKL